MQIEVIVVFAAFFLYIHYFEPQNLVAMASTKMIVRSSSGVCVVIVHKELTIL